MLLITRYMPPTFLRATFCGANADLLYIMTVTEGNIALLRRNIMTKRTPWAIQIIANGMKFSRCYNFQHINAAFRLGACLSPNRRTSDESGVYKWLCIQILSALFCSHASHAVSLTSCIIILL
jgi:hypothetical protein